MKKNFAFFLALIISLAMFTGCGKKDVQTSETPDDVGNYHIDYQGEGEVQGGIKSDEEIAALTEEAESNTVDENSAEYPNVEMETPEAISTYISAENFWQGDDYFDLENYLYMNGANWVKKGTYNYDGTLNESESDIQVYKAQFFGNIYWIITIACPTQIDFEYVGYKVEDKTYFGPYYAAQPAMPFENQRMVTINSAGTQITDKAIETLDDMLRSAKEHPESDNPFQYSSNYNDLYYMTVHNEAPSNAVRR